MLRNAGSRAALPHDDPHARDSLATPSTPGEHPDIRMMAMDIINAIAGLCQQPIMMVSDPESSAPDSSEAAPRAPDPFATPARAMTSKPSFSALSPASLGNIALISAPQPFASPFAAASGASPFSAAAGRPSEAARGTLSGGRMNKGVVTALEMLLGDADLGKRATALQAIWCLAATPGAAEVLGSSRTGALRHLDGR